VSGSSFEDLKRVLKPADRIEKVGFKFMGEIE
jgi:hypothetical protein